MKLKLKNNDNGEPLWFSLVWGFIVTALLVTTCMGGAVALLWVIKLVLG